MLDAVRQKGAVRNKNDSVLKANEKKKKIKKTHVFVIGNPSGPQNTNDEHSSLGQVHKQNWIRDIIQHEKLSVIGIQETKMEQIDQVFVKSLWIWDNVEFAFIGSIGASGGTLIIWNTSIFIKEGVLVGSSFLGAFGKWSGSSLTTALFSSRTVIVIMGRDHSKYLIFGQIMTTLMNWSYLLGVLVRFLRQLVEWDQKAESGKLSAIGVENRDEVIIELHKMDQEERDAMKQKSHIKWEIEGDENSRFFHALLKTTGRLSRGVNPSFITLVSKIKDPIQISDFRPISLIGYVYKVISKVLASRLAKVIDKIISPNQTAFIVVNGSPTKEFQMERGLRQGLSLTNKGANLSLLQYADDALFFGKWSRLNVKKLVRILGWFQDVSSLKVNLSKSRLNGFGVDLSEFINVANLVNCSHDNFPFCYLGLPVGEDSFRALRMNRKEFHRSMSKRSVPRLYALETYKECRVNDRRISVDGTCLVLYLGYMDGLIWDLNPGGVFIVNKLSKLLDSTILGPNELMEFVPPLSSLAKKIFQGVVYVAIWVIWDWRNRVLHTSSSCLHEDIFAKVQTLSLLWLSNRSRKKSLRWRNWVLNPSCNMSIDSL
ncbi:RNA-directed DNA polymerase, eukaryota [Tanacetum coccineum]